MNANYLSRGLSVLASASLVVLPVLAAPSAPALADGTKDDKIAERDEIQQQLEDLRIELDDVSAELADTYIALAETELLIPQAQQDLEEAQAELEEAREEDRKVGERLETAQEEERELTQEVEEGRGEVESSSSELAGVALDAYKGSGPPSPSSVYVGGKSPQDAVDRSMNYRLTMSSQSTRLDSLREDQTVNENSSDRLTAVRKEIRELKEDAEEAVERKSTAEEEAREAKQALDDLYSDQQLQRDDLEEQKEKHEGEQATLESRSSTLDAEIEELTRKERERAEREERERKRRERQEREQAAQNSGSQGRSSNGGGSGGGNSGGGSSRPDESGSGWARPVNARMNSNFGWRVHPVYGYRRMHNGVDFPVACGVPVGSTNSGTVIATGYDGSAGNYVIVSHGIHNGKLVTSNYFHLQGFATSVGQQVSTGTTVGYVGTTGTSTGCHLHFGMQEDGVYVNPANYVS